MENQAEEPRPSLPLVYLVTHPWLGAAFLPEAAGSTGPLEPQA